MAWPTPVGGIERNPYEVGCVGLGPGVAGLLLDDAVVAVEGAADIAGRRAEIAQGGDEEG